MTLAGLAPALASSAFAETTPDRARCLDAYVAAQDSRKAGSLLEARRKLEECAEPACPGMVQRDCTQWLVEVDRALPSVVLAARDANHRDLLDATATVDGQPAPLDGRPVRLDPGKHVVRVRAASGEVREETFLLLEGEQARSHVVVFPPPPAAALPTATTPIPRKEEADRRVPAASWVLGGLGVASLGAFGFFAIRGAKDRTSLGCDQGCSAASYAEVNRDFVVADVALGAAVALVSGAVVWWLTSGEPRRTAPSHVEARTR